MNIENMGLLAGARPGRCDVAAIVVGPDRADARPITHGELEQLCRRVAAHLQHQHSAGDRVAVLGENSAAYLVALLAIAQAGLIAVPMSPRQGAAQIDELMSTVRPVAGFIDAACGDRAPRDLPVTALDLTELERLSGPDRDAGPGGEDIALELFTSGSSGAPKGVLLSHRAMLFSVRRLLAGPPSDVRVLVAAPLFHMNGLMTCLSTLAQGATILMLERFDAEHYLAAIERSAPSVLVGVPTMFAKVLQALTLRGDGARLESVLAVVSGSAPLTDEQRRRIAAAFPNAQVINSYGTTEAFGIFGPHPAGRATPPGSIGAVQSDVEVRFAEGPDVAEGRLLVRTPGSMSGYDGGSTGHSPDDWYDTKDLVRVDADGFYYVVGRADDVINCGGEKVYPEAVEAILETHPDVRTASVVGIADEIKGQIPVAFVVLEPGAAPDLSALKQHALVHGPAYAHPRRIVVVAELPLIGAGKVDKRRLAAEAASVPAAAGSSAQ
jgi:acyl-CoA synthetase (AMP-forming)/AMP-acid ligase II